MQLITRRSFLASVAASTTIAVLSHINTIAAAPDPEAAREFESELTGSTIKLLDDSWRFDADIYEIEESRNLTRETVSVSSETATVEIDFVSTSMSPADYLYSIRDRLTLSWNSYEEIDNGITSDGEWLIGMGTTGDLELAVYVEYQAGAFPDHDLVVTFLGDIPTVSDDLDAMQSGISIGDAEPMFMMEESNVAATTFGSGQQQTSSRNRRRGGSTTETQDPVGGDSGFVDGVIAHRSVFAGEMEQFLTAVLMFGDDAISDAQVQEAFGVMDDCSDLWVLYPDQAARLSAPAEYADLETMYLAWADDIAELGNSWIGARAGLEETSAMFDQLDVVLAADDDLGAALDAL